ncbi:MAG: FtsK/SpoIIIE domain-containing protein [Fuerstiella sp.]
MTADPLTLQSQLHQLMELTAQCGRHQQEQERLQAERTDVEAVAAIQLDELQQQLQQDYGQQRHQIQVQFDQQSDNIRLDVETQQQALRRQHEAFVSDLHSRLNSERRKLEEQRESELWLLQSVLDENVEDSPAAHYDRERDVYATQQTALTQRLEQLSTDLTAAQLYLSSCHAGTDLESLPAQQQSAKREAQREIAHAECDLAAAALQQVYRGWLPQWIRGARLWLLVGTLFVIIWLTVTALQANLRDFVNPDLGQPNWEWAGVAALIAAAISGLTGLILTLVCQNRLRTPFSAAQRHLSNANHAAAVWQQKSESHVEKLNQQSAQWKQQLLQDREQRTTRINDQINQQIQRLQQQQETNLTERTGQLNNQLQRLEQQLAAELEALTRQRDAQINQLAEQHERNRQQQQDAATSTTDAQLQSLRIAAEQNLNAWQDAFARLNQLSSDSTQAAAATVHWPINEGWSLPTAMPNYLPAGDWSATVPEPTSAAQAGNVRQSLHFPAVLRFPTDTTLLVEHDAAGRDAALSFLRTQLLKLLTIIPAGRFRLTLIDPVGLGQSFSAMMHLADFDELLINSRIWTESNQIRDQLQKVTEHMENIFQTYLRSQFETIEEYNQSAGEVAEPYHFVVVAGFPVGFSDEGARHLASILTSGPRCGVHALVSWNPAITPPPSFDVNDLTENAIRFRVSQSDVLPIEPLPHEVKFASAVEPPADKYIQLVRDVGEQSKHARRVEVSFNRIAPRDDAVWTHSTCDGIDLPIGRAGAARLQFLRLGRGTSQHVLIAGKTGSGKSTFLHILITNLALHYGPNELQFYLIDFKKGVEFKTYAQHRLPHARVIAIESDREFGLSVLERLDQILQERGELYRESGVQDLPAYRRRFPDRPMPRLMLLIDEFQEFFVAEDRVSSRASLLLDRLVRQGRAFGIHVLLGSQTLGGAYSLARSTMGQIAVRIALQCSDNDAHLILSEDNSAARLLTRPGEAICNDANGLVEGNHQFQIAWLDGERREAAIHQMLHQSATPQDHGMIVFEGNVAPTAEFCAPMHAALTSDADATSRPTDHLTCWLGEPVAISAPTAIEFRRGSGQNLLIVGQDETQADSLLAFVTLSTLLPQREPLAKISLLVAERDHEAVQRFSELQHSGNLTGLELRDGADVSGFVTSMLQEVERRESADAAANDPTTVLIIRNIGQFRDLRRDENDFGLGGFGEAKPSTPAADFAEIIKRGPSVGLHVVVWSDTFSNATRWLSTSLLREFENRVAFRMNQTDSASLVDSPVAASLTSGRALLYRDQTGTIEKFRPFAWPTDGWLRSLTSASDDATDPEEFDIDSLHIE